MQSQSTEADQPLHHRLVREVLSVVGVFGLAITVYSRFGDFLGFAAWIHTLVETWQAWIVWFWKVLFSWLSVDLPARLAQALTFLLFCVSLVAGANLYSNLEETQSYDHVKLTGVSKFAAWAGAVLAVVGLLGFFLGGPELRTASAVTCCLAAAASLASRIQSGFSIVLLAGIISVVAILSGTGGTGSTLENICVYSIVLIGAILLGLFDSPALRRRCLQFLIALAILLAINEVAKLNLAA